VHELAQELRIPSRHVTAGGAERVVGLVRQGLADEPRARARAQRRGPDHGRQRVGGDLTEEAGVLARLARPEADDDRQAQPFHPRQEVGEPAQRGKVAPVQVVDRDEKRSAGGDVGRQPVEAMERRQRRIPGRLDRQLGGLEERRRERGSADKQLGSLLLRQAGEERLEELPDDAVRERALELGAARAQHLHPRLSGASLRLRHEGRLADSGRALDRKQPTTASGSADESLDCNQLGLTLKEIGTSQDASSGEVYAAGAAPKD
jgi:hypothetical protein